MLGAISSNKKSLSINVRSIYNNFISSLNDDLSPQLPKNEVRSDSLSPSWTKLFDEDRRFLLINCFKSALHSVPVTAHILSLSIFWTYDHLTKKVTEHMTLSLIWCYILRVWVSWQMPIRLSTIFTNAGSHLSWATMSQLPAVPFAKLVTLVSLWATVYKLVWLYNF